MSWFSNATGINIHLTPASAKAAAQVLVDLALPRLKQELITKATTVIDTTGDPAAQKAKLTALINNWQIKI